MDDLEHALSTWSHLNDEIRVASTLVDACSMIHNGGPSFVVRGLSSIARLEPDVKNQGCALEDAIFQARSILAHIDRKASHQRSLYLKTEGVKLCLFIQKNILN